MYIPILMLTLILHVHQVYSEWPLAAAPNINLHVFWHVYTVRKACWNSQNNIRNSGAADRTI
jgi:hypothetical protein